MTRAIKRLCALVVLALLFGSTAAFAQKTYVVCVGISKNRINEAPLPGCREDIRGIAKVFDAFKNSHVFMLLDQNATRAHIIKVLKSEFAKAGPNDEIIFAYSGHGFDGGVSTYNNEEVVYCSEVQDIMLASKAKRKVMLVMACHSGSFAKKHKNNNDSRRNYNKKSDVMLFLSSQADETSILFLEQKYSIFYRHLIGALLGMADNNGDQLITARELFNYVAPRVTNDAALVGHKQHPVMWGRFPDDMVILNLR